MITTGDIKDKIEETITKYGFGFRKLPLNIEPSILSYDLTYENIIDGMRLELLVESEEKETPTNALTLNVYIDFKSLVDSYEGLKEFCGNTGNHKPPLYIDDIYSGATQLIKKTVEYHYNEMKLDDIGRELNFFYRKRFISHKAHIPHKAYESISVFSRPNTHLCTPEENIRDLEIYLKTLKKIFDQKEKMEVIKWENKSLL
tara:strand:+ start:178 stop:783 length:606 start_codon:yes stop_codon:yes gene_type:complete